MFSRYICGLICASALYAQPQDDQLTSQHQEKSITQVIEERGDYAKFSSNGVYVGEGHIYLLPGKILLETLHPYTNTLATSTSIIPQTHIKFFRVTGKGDIHELEIIDRYSNGKYEHSDDAIFSRKNREPRVLLDDPLECERIYNDSCEQVKEMLQITNAPEKQQQSKPEEKNRKASPGQQLSYFNAPRISFF